MILLQDAFAPRANHSSPISSVAWDQAPHWGKKEEKIDERSEPKGSLGRGKGWRPFPLPNPLSANFARGHFSYLTPFLPFSSSAEPGPRLQFLQLFPSKAIDSTLVWTPRYRWSIATRPETQITHTRGGRESLARVDINTLEKENNWSKRPSPTPSESKLSLRPCGYISKVTRPPKIVSELAQVSLLVV